MKNLISVIVLLIVIMSFNKGEIIIPNAVTIEKQAEDIKEVKIGKQVWMVENLNVSTFRNGDTIPEVTTAEDWIAYGIAGKPAWCNYENNSANGNSYGKLYNWSAVKDSRGVAPVGWHIPSNDEFIILSDYANKNDACRKKMKAKTGWNPRYVGYKYSNGKNRSGFTALPGGRIDPNGECQRLGEYAYWWTSSEGDSSHLAIAYSLANTRWSDLYPD